MSRSPDQARTPAHAFEPTAEARPELARAIENVRAAVARAVFASSGLRALAIGAFAVGCLVLIARASFELERPQVAWFFAPLALVPVLAAWDARAKRPSTRAIAAWLDVRSGASGAIVTDHETADPAWSDRVRGALARVHELPRARLGRATAFALAGIAFAVVAAFVPIPRDVPGPGSRVQTTAIERVEEQLATLEEEVTLQPVVAEELRETLERLREDAADATIESTFEALDRAADRVEDEARARAEVAESAAEALDAAASAAESDPEAAQKALESTLSALNAAGLAKGLEGLLPDQQADGKLELPAGTKLDAATLAKLANALDAQLSEKMARLAARGLLKPGAFGKGGRPGDVSEHVCTAECSRNPGGT